VIAITGLGGASWRLGDRGEADLVLDKPFELADLEGHVIELRQVKNSIHLIYMYRIVGV